MGVLSAERFRTQQCLKIAEYEITILYYSMHARLQGRIVQPCRDRYGETDLAGTSDSSDSKLHAVLRGGKSNGAPLACSIMQPAMNADDVENSASPRSLDGNSLGA